MLACFLTAVSAFAAKELLESKHQDMECTDCHAENPPAEAPGDNVCIDCHGGLKEIFAMTPFHESGHAEESGMVDPCESCHHMHKPSVYSCSGCHNFESIDVP